jgi:hypothetical protein
MGGLGKIGKAKIRFPTFSDHIRGLIASLLHLAGERMIVRQFLSCAGVDPNASPILIRFPLRVYCGVRGAVERLIRESQPGRRLVFEFWAQEVASSNLVTPI